MSPLPKKKSKDKFYMTIKRSYVDHDHVYLIMQITLYYITKAEKRPSEFYTFKVFKFFFKFSWVYLSIHNDVTEKNCLIAFHI